MKYKMMILLLCAYATSIAQIPSDMIAHFPMNGEASDASPYHNMGTIVGSVQPTADRFGNPCGALDFDGSTGYITVPSSVSLKRPSDAFTVTVWVKMEQNPSSPQRKWLTVCCKSDLAEETPTSPQYRVQSMQDDSRGYNTVSISTDFTEPAQENLELSRWLFYVLRYDGTQVTAYIDGKTAFTFAYNKTFIPNDLPLEIGRDMPGGMEFFSGSMDDLRIFDRALSVAEISSLLQDKSSKTAVAAVQILCPADITKTAFPGKCSYPVTYLPPTASVDCGTAKVKLVSGLESESQFPVGETTVTYMATSATGSTATCSFKVRVIDNSLPTVKCPKSIVTNNDPGECSAVVQYPDATGGGACAQPALERIQGDASGSDFPLGETRIIYRATDAAGATATCNFTITVRDVEAPTISCPQDMRVQANAGERSSVVRYLAPTFADNCPGSKLSRLGGFDAGAKFPIGTTTVAYQVKDAVGNVANCDFEVVVEAQTADLGLRCPDDMVVPADLGECAADVAFKAATLTGNLPDATVSQVGGAASGSKFPVGSQIIAYRATHSTGKQADCQFKITVQDRQKPRIDCPSDVTMQANAEGKGAKVRYVDPLYDDNCPGSQLSLQSGLKSDAFFPVGTTTVTYQVVDAAGNTATCNFRVNVELPESKPEPEQEPELGLQCPQDIVIPADPGECSAAVRFANAVLTGNLPDATVTQVGGERSGSRLHVGKHNISYKAEHPSGKQAKCSFNITVEDKEKPVIACPNDVHLQAKYGDAGAIYTYNDPDIDDNCPGSVLQKMDGLASGSQFPIGDNKIVFQVQDAAGNTSSCDFVVTVSSSQPELPTRIDGDTIVYQKQIVQVQSNQVRIYFYDNQDQDGDTVSLNYDGHWIVDNEKILAKKKVLEHNAFVELVIVPNKVHYLVSKAWNEGKKPTNTLTIEIHDGVSPPRVLNLTSNIGKSSAIQLYYKK